MIGYFFAIFPFYILVYLPLSHWFHGSPQRTTNPISQILNTSLIATDEPLSCPSHGYNIHILSLEPLMMYIESFLSEKESKHLLEIRYLTLLITSMSHFRTIRSKHVTKSLSAQTDTHPQPSPAAQKSLFNRPSASPKSLFSSGMMSSAVLSTDPALFKAGVPISTSSV
jgi:hypothetical protein